MPAGWNPWRALRGRDHITFARRDLPESAGGGVIAWRADQVFIVLDPSLTQEERKAAMGHELVHEERGPLPEDAPDWLVEWEERQTERENLRRLVPFEALDDLHLRATVHGEQIATWEVAQRFGLPEDVVEAAMRLWWAEQGCERGGLGVDDVLDDEQVA